MKILKASAGSGKTYRLSHTYLDLLLKNWASNPYRHILAVTFTNKATGEMKARILRDLAELAKTDPRARTLLTELLHDYGAFAISTIDRFFQQALKAFSREIGQYADYQVELDKDSLIAEAMDRILDSLTEDSGELLDWIRESLSDTLEQGRRYRVDEGLLEIGRLLKNDEFRELADREGISGKEAFGKERLKRIRESCRAVIRDFSARVEAMGLPVAPGELIKMPGKRALKASPELAELFDEPYRIYCTAFILDGLLFQLGLAGEFYREFDALATEKNVLCLDESNTILRDIINGSDAPFVYEKMGVRFEHFLLDEFQDTSHIQWENFLPLLRESEGKTQDGSLIVGDVKQSIYRFRDSDWELLGSEVEQEFPDAEVETMRENWRSSRTVVGFNARFFRYAAALLGLEDIYTGLDQQVMREDAQEGTVRVDFCEDQTAAILESIQAVRRNGAQWSDIAVLVRNRKEGAAVASSLIGSGIPVISDDSLQLKGSPVVRRLVSLLSCYENPDDRIGRFLADSMNLSFPQEYHSLVDFCEELLRAMQDWDPASFEGQVLFIQAFMDDLQSWVQVNGNNLRYYLKHWEENEFYIGSPENAASVRYNNIQDANAALNIVREFGDTPFALGLKHMNPCGAAIGKDLKEAWLKAYESDPVSIFGGIVATNQVIDLEAANLIKFDHGEKGKSIFLEVILAPGYTPEALEAFAKRPDLRIIEYKLGNYPKEPQYVSVNGGILCQDQDTEIKTITEDMVITDTKATKEQLSDMNFGWKIVKHVKSNAIVVVKNGTTCGVGAGQMNRVGAAKIAIEEAHSRGVKDGLVLASDAFFPFSDTLQYGIDNGVVAVVQPGGSKKDQDSIDLANEKKVPMAFTGMRHFKH